MIILFKLRSVCVCVCARARVRPCACVCLYVDLYAHLAATRLVKYVVK